MGKTAYFLYPNLEYACASGMSFLALDTKGDLARNYGAIARDIYGYRISVVDLREPTCSDGNNLLTLINRYMDEHRENPWEISAKAKAEKYAKILAKTIINPEGEGSDHGQNAYFYDAAEGLLASVVLLLSEFLPPEETDGYETRHIASVFKLVQELLMQGQRGGNQFQELMQLLPSEHKAKWLAGSALTASDQAMNGNDFSVCYIEKRKEAADQKKSGSFLCRENRIRHLITMVRYRIRSKRDNGRRWNFAPYHMFTMKQTVFMRC